MIKDYEVTDFLGRPIKIGDRVVYLTGGSKRAANFNFGYVVRFTDKSIMIDTQKDGSGSPKAPPKIIVIDAQDTDNKYQFPEQFI